MPECQQTVVNVHMGPSAHHVYVGKRPKLDEFLDLVCERFEVVVFTGANVFLICFFGGEWAVLYACVRMHASYGAVDMMYIYIYIYYITHVYI